MPRYSHPAIWGRDPAAQWSGVGVDAYHVSMRSPSSASILELPVVAVKPLVKFFYAFFDAYYGSAGAVPTLCVETEH